MENEKGFHPYSLHFYKWGVLISAPHGSFLRGSGCDVDSDQSCISDTISSTPDCDTVTYLVKGRNPESKEETLHFILQFRALGSQVLVT